MSIGDEFMRSVAQGIIDGTPKVEDAAAKMAERLGAAFADAVDDQRDIMLDSIKRWQSDVEDAISGIYDAVTGRFSEEDAREAVSDQEREIADIEAKLAAAIADPEKAGDVADLEERLSDAQRGLTRDNYRLFKLLMDKSGGNLTNGTGGTENMMALAAAAGLTEAEMWDLRNQYTAKGNAASSAATFGAMGATSEQIGAAFAVALEKVAVDLSPETIASLVAGFADAYGAAGGRLAAGRRG